MTALVKARVLIERRLTQLEGRIVGGDETAWPDYLRAAEVAAAVARATVPGAAAGSLLTTRQMSDLLGISTRTILRRRKAGLYTPAMATSKGGRGAALRWAAP